MSGRIPVERDPDTLCPSCGRFTGPQEVCAWCGARTLKRVSLRILRYGAVVLALLGLVGLWVASRRADLPVVQVRDIDSMMNWAYVRVRGVVSRYPSYDVGSGYLRFWLDDGTGEISIVAYRNESQSLIQEGRIPSVGDVVTVAGTLKIKGDLVSVTLHVPDSLAIEYPDPRERLIGEIGIASVHQKVRIRGQLCAMRYPYEDLTILTVCDETGEIDVVYTTDLVRLTGALAPVEIGDLVELSGAVTLYREQPQISLDTAAALQVIPQIVKPRPTEDRRLPLTEISSVLEGEVVAIDAQIVRAVPFASGERFVLQEGDGQVALVFWQNLYDACPDREALVPGAWISVRGAVKVYQGELEIVPERAGDVVFVEMRELPRVPYCMISDLVPEDVGKSCEIEGHIQAIHRFARGVHWVVDDGTAKITVLLWQNVLDGMVGEEAFEVGGQVRVRGEVAIYQGALELVPAAPGDLVWLAPAPTPSPTTTAAPTSTATDTPVVTATPTTAPVPTSTPTPAILIVSTGGVTEEHLGRDIVVEGTIVEITQFATGVKCYLDDGSGPVALWIPQEIFAQLAAQETWTVGNVVRTRGIVEEYKEELEIVPQTAAETMVTAISTPLPLEIVRMADLGLGHVGQRITVEGIIVTVEPFSQGVKYLLDDGSGKVTLLLWQSVLDTLPGRERLAVGALIRASGKVNEYRGELEVVPGIAGDLSFR